MGKKSKIRKYPQKFARKHSSHPYAKAQAELKKILEGAAADNVITPEEAKSIEEAKQLVIDSVTDVAAEDLREAIKPLVETAEKVTERAKKAAESISKSLNEDEASENKSAEKEKKIEEDKTQAPEKEKKKQARRRTTTKRVVKKKTSKG